MKNERLEDKEKIESLTTENTKRKLQTKEVYKYLII